MEIINLFGQLPWQGSMGRRDKKEIKYAIVHHDAELAGDTYDAESKYIHEANYHISKGWKHIGYTFKIARDGKVYQNFPLEEIGVHAGNYLFFRNSVGICLDGSFDKQQPSSFQRRALKDLMVHLATEMPEVPNLVQSSFYAHREVRGVGFPGTKLFIPSFTFCPSPEVTEIVKTYRLTGK